MGYTHYWYQKRSLTDLEWSEICANAKKIFKNNKNLLANGEGKAGTNPQIEEDFISFNGIEGDSHESCFLTKGLEFPKWQEKRNESFHFCKTALKPYDSVVVEFLKMVRNVTNDAFRLESDGEKVFD